MEIILSCDPNRTDLYAILHIMNNNLHSQSHNRIRIYEYAAAVMYPFILREPADVSM